MLLRFVPSTLEVWTRCLYDQLMPIMRIPATEAGAYACDWPCVTRMLLGWAAFSDQGRLSLAPYIGSIASEHGKSFRSYGILRFGQYRQTLTRGKVRACFLDSPG